MSILINASNLHNGGGVQVAASFIAEIYNLKRFDVSIVCSDVVLRSLPSDIDIHKFKKFKIINVYGFKHFKKGEKKFFTGYKVCFTIFGPFYHKIPVI